MYNFISYTWHLNAHLFMKSFLDTDLKQTD